MRENEVPRILARLSRGSSSADFRANGVKIRSTASCTAPRQTWRDQLAAASPLPPAPRSLTAPREALTASFRHSRLLVRPVCKLPERARAVAHSSPPRHRNRTFALLFLLYHHTTSRFLTMPFSVAHSVHTHVAFPSSYGRGGRS